MKSRMSVFGFLHATVLGAMPSTGIADAALGKDLKATIALQGQSCDQIVSSKRNADSDYLVLCKDGNRYHIFVSAQGRVIVEKL